MDLSEISEIKKTANQLLTNLSEELSGNEDVIFNIQQLLSTQEMLIKEYSKVNEYLQVSDTALFSIDNEGVIVDTNKQFCLLFGLQQEQLIDKKLTNYIFKHSQEIFYYFINDVLDNRSSETCTIQLYSENWIKIKGLYSQSSECTLIRCIARDITNDINHLYITEEESFQLKSRIDSFQKEFDIILKNELLGILYLTKNRKILKINNKLCNILGYASHEIEGKNSEILHISHEHYIKFGEKYYQTLKQKTLTTECSFKHKNGSLIRCRITGKAIDRNNLDKGIIWLFDDIEKEKKAIDQNISNLKFLSETAIDSISLKFEYEFFDYISKKIHEISNGIVLVSKLKHENRKLILNNIVGIDKILSNIIILLGGNPLYQEFEILEEDFKSLMSKKIHLIPYGISKLSRGKVSLKVGKKIDKLVGVSEIYGMGLSYSGKLYGSIIIIVRGNNKLINTSLIEAFINQSAIVLQKIYSKHEVNISKLRYENLYNSLNQGIVIFNDKGDIFDCNEISLTILGYNKNDLLGNSIFDFLKKSMNIDSYENIKKIDYESEFKDKVLAVFNPKKKDYVWLRINLKMVLYPDIEQIKEGYAAFEDITDHLKSQKTIKITNFRLEQAINVGKLAWWEWNVVTGEVVYHHRKATMLGYNLEESPKTVEGFCELLHPEDYEPTMENMRKHLQGITPEYNVEYRIKTKLNTWKWYYDKGQITERNNDNTPKKLIGVVFDISDRKIAELKLAESENKFRTLFNSISDIIILCDLKGDILEANKTACSLFGYSYCEFVKLNIKDLELENDYIDILSLRDTLKSSNNILFTKKFIASNSDIIPSEVNITQINFEGKELFLNIIRDITEREVIENVLREHSLMLENQNEELLLSNKKIQESEARFKAIFNFSKVGMAIINTDGSFKQVNQHFADILGYTINDILNLDFIKISYKSDLEKEKMYIDEVLAGERDSYVIQKRYYHKNLNIIWVKLHSTVIRNENGEIKYAIAVIDDISQQKKAEEQLIISEHRFSAFMSNIPLVAYIKDENKKMVYTNKYMHKWYGSDKWIGLHTDEFFPKNISNKIEIADKEAIRKDKYINEIEVINKKGEKRIIESYKFSIKLPNNDIYIGGIGLDITERKEIEKRIIESEANYRLLAENSIDAIWQMNLKLIFTYISPSIKELTGHTPEEWIGTKLSEHSHFKHFVKMAKQALFAVKNYKKFKYTVFTSFLIHKDGTLIPVEISAKLLRNKKGIPIGLQGATRNISERIKAENEIKEYQNNLEEKVQKRTFELALLNNELKTANMIIEASPVMLYRIKNKKGLPVDYISKNFIQFGYTEQEVMENKNFIKNFIFYEDYKEVLEKIKFQIDNNIEYYYFDYRALTKEGELIWVEQKNHIVLDNKNKIIYYEGTLTDITGKKNTELSLQESEEKLRNLIDQIPVGILLTDEKGLIIESNYKLEEIIGIKKFNSLNTPVCEIIYKLMKDTDSEMDSEKEVQTMVKDYLNFGIASFINKTFEKKIELKQTIKYVQFIIFGVRTIAGRVLGIVIEDITNKKIAEDKIRKALIREKELNSMKSTFVSMTSHQFRTPLTTIMINSEMIEMYSEMVAPEISEKIIKAVKIITNEILRLDELMGDVLTIEKIESGKITFKPITFNLKNLVEDMIENHKFQNQDNRTVLLKTTGTNYNVIADKKLFRHILQNLISNAFKYSDNSDPEMNIYFESNQLILKISDDGIGIPIEQQEFLFNTFFRAKNAKKIKGSGLGLSIVKEYVELHNGVITFSSAENKGTEFTITIPQNKN